MGEGLKFIFSRDLIPSGWLGSKHQPSHSLLFHGAIHAASIAEHSHFLCAQFLSSPLLLLHHYHSTDIELYLNVFDTQSKYVLGWLCCPGEVWEPIREASWHAIYQGTLICSCLSLLSHCGLILALRVQLVCSSWSSDLKKKVQAGNDLSNPPPPTHTHTHLLTCKKSHHQQHTISGNCSHEVKWVRCSLTANSVTQKRLVPMTWLEQTEVQVMAPNLSQSLKTLTVM